MHVWFRYTRNTLLLRMMTPWHSSTSSPSTYHLLKSFDVDYFPFWKLLLAPLFPLFFNLSNFLKFLAKKTTSCSISSSSEESFSISSMAFRAVDRFFLWDGRVSSYVYSKPTNSLIFLVSTSLLSPIIVTLGRNLLGKDRSTFLAIFGSSTFSLKLNLELIVSFKFA